MVVLSQAKSSSSFASRSWGSGPWSCEVSSPSGRTDEITTLRTAVNALAARVRTHDEQPRCLTRN